jgi:hypothetical protein
MKADLRYRVKQKERRYQKRRMDLAAKRRKQKVVFDARKRENPK